MIFVDAISLSSRKIFMFELGLKTGWQLRLTTPSLAFTTFCLLTFLPSIHYRIVLKEPRLKLLSGSAILTPRPTSGQCEPSTLRNLYPTRSIAILHPLPLILQVSNQLAISHAAALPAQDMEFPPTKVGFLGALT